MAVAIQDHIHLDTANPPVATYSAQQASWDHTPSTAVTHERSITGKLHVHRLLTGSDPIQFEEDKEILICSLAEMLVVRALAGKRVYYVNSYHDDDEAGAGAGPSAYSGSSYTERVLLMIPDGAITNLDPMATWWTVQIQILDDSAVT